MWGPSGPHQEFILGGGRVRVQRTVALWGVPGVGALLMRHGLVGRRTSCEALKGPAPTRVPRGLDETVAAALGQLVVWGPLGPHQEFILEHGLVVAERRARP